MQRYSNHSDIVGGSTLGSVSGSHVSVCTADIGLAQLSMHSAFETAGAYDIEDMYKALKAFYETVLRPVSDEEYDMLFDEARMIDR